MILPWLDIKSDVLGRIYEQIEHSASLRSPCLDGVLTPSFEELRNLTEVAFWASLRSDEERPTRVRIVLASPRLRLAGTDPIAFQEPVDFNQQFVAKLAHVVPAFGSLLVCRENDREDGRLKIWGFANLPYSLGISAEIIAPGVVRMDIDCLRHYVVLRESSAYFLDGGGPVTLPDFLRRRMRKSLPTDDFVATQQAWRECLVLGALARVILEHGHGGTILVVPEVNGKWEQSLDPFLFKFARPDTAAQEWISQDLKYGLACGRAIECISSASLSEEEKNEITAALARPNRQWQPQLAVHHIAPLANYDGAIVLTNKLEILGFGAKIASSSTDPLQVCRFNPVPGPQKLCPCKLEELGGTRHQSAARFVAENREAVSVVVSQDGHITILYWNDEHECIFAAQNAEWWV